jgi:hypothetical protein
MGPLLHVTCQTHAHRDGSHLVAFSKLQNRLQTRQQTVFSELMVTAS